MDVSKYLAHSIVHQGVVHPLSLLTITCADGIYNVAVEPFTCETPATAFHNGTIAVCATTNPAAPLTDPYYPTSTPPHLIFLPRIMTSSD